jgi:hypothetical protein
MKKRNLNRRCQGRQAEGDQRSGIRGEQRLDARCARDEEEDLNRQDAKSAKSAKT